MNEIDYFQFIYSILSNYNFLAKIMLLILTPIYGAFALILSVQIRNFDRLIKQESTASILVNLSYLNIAAAVALFVIAVLFL